MSDKFAVRVAGPAFQMVLRMERQDVALPVPGPATDADMTDIETIAAAVAKAAAAGTPLVTLDEDGQHATMLIPGPGMSFSILPWAEHLEGAARARAAQEAAQQQGGRPPLIAGARGFGALPRNGQGKRGRG